MPFLCFSSSDHVPTHFTFNMPDPIVLLKKRCQTDGTPAYACRMNKRGEDGRWAGHGRCLQTYHMDKLSRRRLRQL